MLCITKPLVQFSSVQSLSRVWFFATPCPAACHAFLSIINSQSLFKLMYIESVMLFNHLSSCPQSFPASGYFPTNQLFASGGQNIGALASVPPMNIPGWFLLGLTGLISLQSKGLSRVFSRTVIQRHQFFSAQPSLRSNFFMVTSVLDYWKNHCFDYMDLCRQSDVSAF